MLKQIKSISRIMVFMFMLLPPQIVTAQGTTTFLSNLGQTASGSLAVGTDSWVAAGFFTGPNAGGYLLNSVQLGMTDASGNPSGFTVMVFSQSINLGGVFPGSSLGTLTGSADPASSGTYTYTPAASLTILPQSYYFIILTAGTLIANGAYDWGYAGANNYNANGDWFAGPFAESGNGSTWNFISNVYPQFAIYATPVPEPSVIGLFALGGLLAAFQRWKARSV